MQLIHSTGFQFGWFEAVEIYARGALYMYMYTSTAHRCGEIANVRSWGSGVRAYNYIYSKFCFPCNAHFKFVCLFFFGFFIRIILWRVKVSLSLWLFSATIFSFARVMDPYVCVHAFVLCKLRYTGLKSKASKEHLGENPKRKQRLNELVWEWMQENENLRA